MKEWCKVGLPARRPRPHADLTASITATTPRTPSCSSARTTCGARGLASPDDGDALALTFAHPVAKRDWAEERRFEEGLARLKRWVR